MMLSRRFWRTAIASVLLSTSICTYALDTATITGSALSPDCIAYRVRGICYWLLCTITGCSVETSVKVEHYVPDAVVSSYSNTGENPWVEVRAMSPSNPTAHGGGDGTTNEEHENNLAKFKNADVIGHPGAAVFNQFVSQLGFTCAGAGTAFMPYLLSTLDTVAWRYNIPESVYPESLVPGTREIGTRIGLNLWGNVYPRGGFLHHVDDYKAAAVVAQRAGDIVTRSGQPHVYQPLIANVSDGYWPAGALMESDAATGKWQELTPTLMNTCAVFPHTNFVGIHFVGDVDNWSQWLDAHAGYFFVWRLCLYGATVYGWIWMRRRLRERDTSTEAHQRLLRAEVGAIATVLLLEASMMLQ